MSIQATNKVLGIPALHSAILDFLPNKDLDRCKRVSSAFQRNVDALQYKRASKVEKIFRNLSLCRRILRFAVGIDDLKLAEVSRDFHKGVSRVVFEAAQLLQEVD